MLVVPTTYLFSVCEKVGVLDGVFGGPECLDFFQGHRSGADFRRLGVPVSVKHFHLQPDQLEFGQRDLGRALQTGTQYKTVA